MSGIQRSHKEITYIVKICEETLRKRLSEIANTPSAELSVQSFNSIWLEASADPPSFGKENPKKRDASNLNNQEDDDDPFQVLEDDDPFADMAREIDPFDIDDDPFAEMTTGMNTPMTSDSQATVTNDTTACTTPTLQHLDALVRQITAPTSPISQANTLPPSPTTANTIETDMTNAFKPEQIASIIDKLDRDDAHREESLSDLDDDPEVSNALLGDNEAEFKKLIWTTDNADWEAKEKSMLTITTLTQKTRVMLW